MNKGYQDLGITLVGKGLRDEDAKTTALHTNLNQINAVLAKLCSLKFSNFDVCIRPLWARNRHCSPAQR